MQLNKSQVTAMDFDERDLRYTMEEFLDEENTNHNILNFATITGLVIIFLTFSYVLQSLIGLSWGPDLSGLIEILPVIGGVLVVIIGFGFLAGNKRKRSGDMLENDMEARSEKRSATAYSTTEHQQSQEQKEKNEKFRSREFDTSERQSTESSGIDSYGLRQTKKLYKSRTDKKLCGVCGGIARYFDISSTLVRLLFVVAAFMSGGSVIVLYIALCIVLKMEPPELMDDFDEKRASNINSTLC